MKNEEICALYDAMITAECCGDYATAFAIGDKLEKNNVTILN